MNVDALRELGYTVDVYEPPGGGDTVYGVRGYGVAGTFTSADADSHYAALVDEAAHAERVKQHRELRDELEEPAARPAPNVR